MIFTEQSTMNIGFGRQNQWVVSFTYLLQLVLVKRLVNDKSLRSSSESVAFQM